MVSVAGLGSSEGRSQGQWHTQLQKAVGWSQHQQPLYQPRLNTATLAGEQLKHSWYGKHPRHGNAWAGLPLLLLLLLLLLLPLLRLILAVVGAACVVWWGR